MRITFLAAIIALTLPVTSLAITFERDDTSERQAFTTEPLSKITIMDPADDSTVFISHGEKRNPPLLADLRRVDVEPGEDGWVVYFQIEEPLPADPGMPVNFHIYIDRENVPNSPNGVYRTDSDMVFMLLFGTRTKWHTEWWTYDQSGRWAEQTTYPPFTTEGDLYSMTIPYEILSRDSNARIRFLSLTSDNAGLTSIDVAPGTGIPPVNTTPTSAASDAGMSIVSPSGMIGLFLIIVILGALFIRWKRLR